METAITQAYLDRSEGREAEAILRSCVHCGFCTATCPTYQLLGDELDGPRGRIYLIKLVLEGNAPSRRTQNHLDRCLSCRACETTCPSGVRYARLADIGREIVEEQVPRPARQRLQRFLLRKLLPHPGRVALLLTLGRAAAPLLPRPLRRKLPPPQVRRPRPASPRPRRMLLLEGCVQQAAAPHTNDAAVRLLHRLGISLQSRPAAGCCGALSHHLAAPQEARRAMRRNIDAWWPEVEAGAEAILASASGCGLMLKEYGALLADDPAYAAKAARVASLIRDLGEVVAAEPLERLGVDGEGRTLAVHAPCTLQHGQRLPGLVEGILERLNFRLTPVADAHLCCGSAGSYSLLQPELSRTLLAQKLANLTAGAPDLIVTANIGCQLHLASASPLPVRHWIELLDEALPQPPQGV